MQYILSYSNSGSTYIDYNGLCGVSFVVITQCLTTAVYANKACMDSLIRNDSYLKIHQQRISF